MQRTSGVSTFPLSPLSLIHHRQKVVNVFPVAAAFDGTIYDQNIEGDYAEKLSYKFKTTVPFNSRGFLRKKRGKQNDLLLPLYNYIALFLTAQHTENALSVVQHIQRMPMLRLQKMMPQ